MIRLFTHLVHAIPAVGLAIRPLHCLLVRASLIGLTGIVLGLCGRIVRTHPLWTVSCSDGWLVSTKSRRSPRDRGNIMFAFGPIDRRKSDVVVALFAGFSPLMSDDDHPRVQPQPG